MYDDLLTRRAFRASPVSLAYVLQSPFATIAPKDLDEFRQAGLLEGIIEFGIDGQEVLDHAGENRAHRTFLKVFLIESIAGFREKPLAILLGQQRPSVETIDEDLVSIRFVLH